MSPALWREVVAWIQQAYQLSERRAVAVDVHARECVVIRAGKGFKGKNVAAILCEAAA